MSAPMPHGGTIVPGQYLLTAATDYTGVGGATGPTGTTGQIESDNDGVHIHHTQRVTDANGGVVEEHLAGTFTTSGVNLKASISCPTVYDVDYTYDAAASSFTLYQTSSPGPHTLALTYTKR